MQMKPILALLAAGALASTPLAHAAGDTGWSAGGSAQSGSMQTSQGEHAEAVKQIQQALNDQGHDAGPVDGIVGEQTRSAVRDFQEAQGMQASGQVDRETLSALGLDAESAEFSAFVESEEGAAPDTQMQDSGTMPPEGGGMTQEPAAPPAGTGTSPGMQ